MKLVATLALGAALAAVSPATAEEHVTHSPTVTTVYTTPAPMSTRRVYSQSRSSRSVFGQLMDLERRKNAWLRRTFLGR